MAKKTLILLALLFLVISCQTREKWHTSTVFALDTVCEIRLFCSTPSFKSAQQEIHRIFSEIETLFSPGAENYSSTLVLTLFRTARKVYDDSSGCFDITVGPLSRAWGFRNDSHYIPAPEHLQAILRLIGMEKIKEEAGTLILVPGMELDWGGIAKGLGIGLASQAVIKMGVENGFINAGGNLYCWGKNPDKEPWKVGIKHPRKNGFLGVLSISQAGAATSGDYQRYFEADGVRYHHIFDPRTGYPAQGKQSVTVIGPEPVLCDALSTALFVAPKPEKILEKYPEYGAVIVDSKGSLKIIGKKYPFQPFD